MADRIEYQGDPLPTGLPGFGGASVQTLTLPGFNTVVAPLKFGPVVDAINAVPPNPTPPIGSNPNTPTEEVVNPGPAPVPIGGGITIPSFCKQCESSEFLPDIQPLFYGFREQDVCIDCSGEEIPIDYYAPKQTINSGTEFIYYNAPDGLGYTGPNEAEWYLQKSGITGNEGLGATWGLEVSRVQSSKPISPSQNETWQLDVSGVRATNSLNKKWELNLNGVRTLDADGVERLFSPMKLDICDNGQTRTIHILAYQEP